MPEQLTKHPEVTLQVLRSGGATCAQGATQDILTRCPAERFCKLPGGEICVYGWAEARQMTQPTATDWQALARAVAPADPGPAAPDALLVPGGIGLLIGLALGAALAAVLLRRSAARGSR